MSRTTDCIPKWPLLIVLSACGFPPPPPVNGGSDEPPADAPPGDAAPIDAPEQPSFTIRVSPAGDDANDGISLPVKTLKHAIGIAAVNTQFTTVALASGRYSTASGETFPYTVPAGAFIVGPAGGGAILVGTRTEPGLTVNGGTLRDPEFEDFTVAVTATGAARLSKIRIRGAALAMRAETTAKLTIDDLDIMGTVAACATGIKLVGKADLMVAGIATRNLDTTLDAQDQSTVSIARMTVTGDPGCMPGGTTAHYVMTGSSTGTVMLSDGIIDGGNYGIGFSHARTTLMNMVIRNMKGSGLI